MHPKTVWSTGSLDDVQHNMRPLIRVALPILDVALIIFGVTAFVAGSPSVAAVTLSPVAEVWSILLAGSSAAALVGLVFMKAWCEMYAKIVLGAVLLTYALWGAVSPSRTGTLSALLGASLAVGAVAVLGWRIYYLSGKIGRQPR